MKKFIFTLMIVSAFGLSKAQVGFQAGVTTGFPIGDISDLGGQFNLSLNAAYLFEISEKVQIGPEISYDMWLNGEYTITEPVTGTEETIDSDDISYLPIAANLRFQVAEKMMLGGNLGYAIGLADGAEGGFYYMPKLGYSTEYFDLFGFYKGIADDNITVSSIGLGFMYKF